MSKTTILENTDRKLVGATRAHIGCFYMDTFDAIQIAYNDSKYSLTIEIDKIAKPHTLDQLLVRAKTFAVGYEAGKESKQ